MTKAKARLITIIVEGGCVQDVENLPDNWEYEIVDNDMVGYEICEHHVDLDEECEECKKEEDEDE